ncbi:hypothetical protein BC939DRAFT_436003 [Gamsiella multidivaricata]|uniref:uncharacterized protein n=1 Tax=Gamsiella multidivaricata TaxID=101098 RepID=UPI00221E5238|nr:uncharacterized protein BC939DRAFT_436003 [Gamsiella multidivaricata]KAI7831685.1 hypothetical protein BC939DRAFT_436003 [Gamsiella multidivaricata]
MRHTSTQPRLLRQEHPDKQPSLASLPLSDNTSRDVEHDAEVPTSASARRFDALPERRTRPNNTASFLERRK